jgi:hypothetical protein
MKTICMLQVYSHFPFLTRLQKKRMDEDHMRNDGKESDLRPSAVYQILSITLFCIVLHCRL